MFRFFGFGKRKKKNDNLDPKWNLELAPGLTKKKLWDYYYHYGDELLEDIKDHPTIVIQVLNNRPILRRKFGETPIKIKKKEAVDDPQDLLYWATRRTVEFHKVVPDEVDFVIVDIDPGSAVKFQRVRDIAKDLVRLLQAQTEIKDTEVRFSGGRGFYVLGYLKEKWPIDRAREWLKNLLRIYMQGKHDLTLHPPSATQVRLDLSPMKRGGSFRALGSVNLKTGLRSIRVPFEQIDYFRPCYMATVPEAPPAPILKP